jgi:hypothetical protein
VKQPLAAGALLFGVLGVFIACDAPSSPYEDVEVWACFSDGSSCGCRGTDAGVMLSDSRPRVVSCDSALSCCFVRELGDGSFDCTCIEVGGSSGAGGEGGGQASGEGGQGSKLACASAASEHGTSDVGVRCPPVELDDSAVCSLRGESCDPA